MSTLSERIARDPETWKPAEGDVLEGTVVDVASRESEYSGGYPVISVETDDGTEWEFHGFHTVAAGELARLDPHTGDRIAIKYQGQKAKTDGGKFHGYRILLERAERAPVMESAPATPDPARLQPRLGTPHPGEESF